MAHTVVLHIGAMKSGTSTIQHQLQSHPDLLAEQGIRARVVSMPCREWFEEQDASYRETVIPPTVKARVSVEAGIAQGWREVVGDHGRIISIEHYGASADYERIYREFGITVVGVAKTAFRTAEHALEVRRGASTRPLYVTAAGMPPEEAATLVQRLSGSHRIPDALRAVDRLSRGLPQV